MIKQSLIVIALVTLFGGCSSAMKKTPDNTDRVVASIGSHEGIYLTKAVRNEDGKIGILREFELIRNYSGRNLKGIIIEVFPFNGYANRTRVDVSLNGRSIETHDVLVRNGRDHLYTDIDMEVRDEIRELSLRYNPMEVSVRSITVLLNEDRPWEIPGPGPGPRPGDRPGDRDDRHDRRDRDSYSQVFERVLRNRGGGDYSFIIPSYVEARYVTFEAINAPVVIYSVTAAGQSVQMPMSGRYGTRLVPGMPVEVLLPSWGRVDDLRIRAEGMQSDSVALKVTVSSRPNAGDRPDPGHRQPPPPRMVTEQCTVTRFDPAGMLVQSYVGSATGVFGSDVRGQACQNAMMDCRREIRGFQTCR